VTHRTLIVLAAAAGLACGLAARPPAPMCPAGYLPREVRIDHQRLEPDPAGQPVVIPNTWPEDASPGSPPDRRYVAAITCVRPLTAHEITSHPYTAKDRHQ